VGAEILAVMKELAAGGMTMIIATHEMEFARNVCDRVMVMVNGRIIEEGDPHVVMSSPSHERTREFLKAVVGR
jgi:polar amino acid transport system ATP-binding protein